MVDVAGVGGGGRGEVGARVLDLHQARVDEALHDLAGTELAEGHRLGDRVDGRAAGDDRQHLPLLRGDRDLGGRGVGDHADADGQRRDDGLDRAPLGQTVLRVAQDGLDGHRLTVGDTGTGVEDEAALHLAEQLEEDLGEGPGAGRFAADHQALVDPDPTLGPVPADVELTAFLGRGQQGQHVGQRKRVERPLQGHAKPPMYRCRCHHRHVGHRELAPTSQFSERGGAT